MIRVVHLFDVKPSVSEPGFLEWLDAKLGTAARQFGCVDRRTWVLLDGFAGSYSHPKPIPNRAKYVNEAFWSDMDGPNQFRDWLTGTPDGREIHDRWFNSIENHTVLRYVDGWAAMKMDE
jgi:hypothetical protein